MKRKHSSHWRDAGPGTASGGLAASIIPPVGVRALEVPSAGVPTVGALLVLALAIGTWTGAPGEARSCPFCSTASQTLSQEISSADATVIASLVATNGARDAASATTSTLGEGAPGEEHAQDLGRAKFRILEVLRGEEKLQGAKEIEVVYFGEATDKPFLITGIAGIGAPAATTNAPPRPVDWTTPLPLSSAALDYVRRVLTLPASGAERLAFFQQYFEHEDPLLAQDAYDEFSRAPYADVKALGPQMEHDKLIGWIENPRVGPSSRRLYLTMLGVCGRPDDVPKLEQILSYDYQPLQSGVAAALSAWNAFGCSAGVGLVDDLLHAEERRQKESLDAMIACYLVLKGPEGLELVDRHYLGNPRVEYKYLHSAIMALRFHGEEASVVPRERLLESMRLALDHREFADQVIPDLTRWEDWSILDRLIGMFKASPPDDWIRQPVASYLLVAEEQPGEVGTRAANALNELEALDPQSIKRARSLAAFSMLPRASAVASNAERAASAGPASAGPQAPGDATSQEPATASTSGPSTSGPGTPNPADQEEQITAGDANAVNDAAKGIVEPDANEEVPSYIQSAQIPPVSADPNPTVNESQTLDSANAPAADPGAGAQEPTQGPQSKGAEGAPPTPEPLAAPSDAMDGAAKGPVPPKNDADTPKPPARAASDPEGPSTAPLSRTNPAPSLKPPGTLVLVGAPLVAGLILVGIFAVMLRASDPGGGREIVETDDSGT